MWYNVFTQRKEENYVSTHFADKQSHKNIRFAVCSEQREFGNRKRRFGRACGQKRRRKDYADTLADRHKAIDNLRMQCKLLGIPADETYLKETLKLVSLAPESRLKVKEFSLGMKQRLAIAMAVVGKPEILIMDEPTNGLDPQGIHDIREFLVKLNEEYGTTIIVSSHILTELSKFVKEYVFMNNGKVVARSSPEEVEKLCGKHLRIVVDNVEVAKSVLSQMGEVRPTAINTLEFTGKTPSTEVVMALAQANVNVASIVNVGDSLEEFFIKLVGENK